MDDTPPVKPSPPAGEGEAASLTSEPSPDQVATDQGMEPAETAPDPIPETKAENPRPAAKPGKRAKAEHPDAAPAQSKDGAADDTPPGEKRKVSLKVSVTTAHVEAMKPLVARGLPQRDVLALAGRRAMKRFDPTPEFVPMPEGDRVPMTVAYSTTKYVPADMLDAMRDVHDPLRVKSDAAMVRGQFETLFWSVLDDVIEELRQQRR
ncbi:hypothetical protein [Jannaschia rubra]|uniref:hypothetical protein n=1 Tax=Jannaschia rubra TaxID=282197 RepID=UPI00130EA810|nr:hypothetical protein [Jannaschia rubra]